MRLAIMILAATMTEEESGENSAPETGEELTGPVVHNDTTPWQPVSIRRDLYPGADSPPELLAAWEAVPKLVYQFDPGKLQLSAVDHLKLERLYLQRTIEAQREIISAYQERHGPLGQERGVPPHILERRKKIMDLWQHGYSRAVMAQTLNCSEETVKRELKAMGLKLRRRLTHP